MIREPSLKLSFVPFVVNWSDDVSLIAYRSLNQNFASSPALLHQVEALTTSVDARRKTRPVDKLNFILTDLCSFQLELGLEHTVSKVIGEASRKKKGSYQ